MISRRFTLSLCLIFFCSTLICFVSEARKYPITHVVEADHANNRWVPRVRNLRIGDCVRWKNLKPNYNVAQIETKDNNTFMKGGFYSGFPGHTLEFRECFHMHGHYFYTSEKHATEGMKGTIVVLRDLWESYQCQNEFFSDDSTAGRQFGFQVAMSGDGRHAIIGSLDSDDGRSSSAYFYSIDAELLSNTSRETGERSKGEGDPWHLVYQASDGPSYSKYASSVAMDYEGKVAVVGAFLEDNDSGAIYIYHRTTATWKLHSRISCPERGVGAGFGFSVAVSGDGKRIVAGAPTDFAGRGAVYVYTYDANTRGSGGDTDHGWMLESKLAPPENNPSTGRRLDFGWSIALDLHGSALVVGAPRYTSYENKTGVAYILNRIEGSNVNEEDNNNNNNRNPGTVADWVTAAVLTSSICEKNAFGFSVSIAGRFAIIGDPMGRYGTAHIYRRKSGNNEGNFDASDDEWELVDILYDGHDQFGTSVGVNEFGRAIVGSPKASVDLGSHIYYDAIRYPGLVYMYDRTPDVHHKHPSRQWRVINTFASCNGDDGNKFGQTASMSSDGTKVLVGAPLKSFSAENGGSAFTFLHEESVLHDNHPHRLVPKW